MLLGLLPAVVLGAARHARLGKVVVDAPPRSRVFSHIIPANGSVWPTAIYWCLVQVGTPPVDFPVAIDSGSGDLDIAGIDCDGCVASSPAYDPSASSTSKSTFPYVFSNTYETCDLTDPTASCTIAGRVYRDTVSLAGYEAEVSFGSIKTQTSNFDQFQQIDGVIGFTGGGDMDVFAQIVKTGVPDVWGICMHEGSTSNGTLVIGGVDERLGVGEIFYVSNAGSYYDGVVVESLIVAGRTRSRMVARSTIAVGSTAILDTGTNVLLLPTDLLAELEASVCTDDTLVSCEDLFDNVCLDLTDDQVDAYPDLLLRLEGIDLTMTSRDYLLRGSALATTYAQYCIGIRDGGSDGGSGFIIGDTTMRNYYVIFDAVNSTVGWVPVNPETCGSIV
ncbi:hypothetical protein CTAYLR_006201 [Chrysophaeum taylorii]|uniref:Peptidase A1 domain-containing protein n=1 Tax=Chrysophaeum taylorii TaxID=2483200 RepID=A0AAD7XRC8_9STRA|nr:hypothetical protein CTAYLR_006201 [Chrysophaeum taylorii]